MTTNYIKYVKIEALTPVHIGAGQEKKWIKGLDYFYDNGILKIVDINFIFENANADFLSKIANEITQQNLFNTKLINKNNLHTIYCYPHDREPEEIFTQIRTGLGVPYIPGSSIKGAIRSAILGYLYTTNSNFKRLNKEKIDDEIFGSVDNSLMRFIQITDAHFTQENMGLFNTKIYSMNSKFDGQWKHLRTGSKPEFDTNGFVSTYECISSGSISAFRINITEPIINILEKENRAPKNTRLVIKPLSNQVDPINELFKMINEHAEKYLDKEINFFEHHEGEKSEIIIQQLKSILDEVKNCQQDECILHLGSGSGFHGITGDWQFDTHIINGIGQRHRGTINGNNAAKTRRLIFINNGTEFYPFGFIKLTIISEEDYNKLKQEINTYNEEYFSKIKNKTKINITNTIQQQNNKEENITNNVGQSNEREIKPYSGKIKQGVSGIPAEVVESGKPNKVKIYIENYSKNDIVILRGYSSELPAGKKIYVRLSQVTKDGEVKEVTFEKLF